MRTPLFNRSRPQFSTTIRIQTSSNRIFRVSLLAIFMVAAFHRGAAQENSEETFKPFKLRTLDGKERTLTDFSNKAVLVSFFFPTCPYCNQSLPQVQRIYDQYKDKGLSMVWINTV